MRRTWRVMKVSLWLALASGLAVGAGFLVFVDKVTDEAKNSITIRPQTLPKADGIVVWTGPGGGRLQAGADVLQADRGERLLISGVNGANAREDIVRAIDLPEELAACCLDLDYAAIDTASNARETWAWVEALGYEHIILVTSAYHMPRAQVALGTQAGRIRVTPYPVGGDDYKGWWKDAELRTRLTREYGKLLVSYFRDPATSPTRDTPVMEIELSD